MAKYFFLGSVLPPIKIGSKIDLSFEGALDLLRSNLKSADLKKVDVLRLYIDLKNVQQLLKKQPLDRRGNLSEKELRQALHSREGLPQYLFDYLEEQESVESQVHHFSKVFSTFFSEMRKTQSGFLKFYFHFEWEWRLALMGYRAKRLGLDLTRELQYEDASSPVVAQILAQKDAPFFEFPMGYEELDERLKEAKGEPRKEYEMMARFRFNKLSDRTQDEPFSIDYILGYLLQVIIIEDWNALDETQGNQNLTGILKGNV